MILSHIVDGRQVIQAGDREELPVRPLSVKCAKFFFIDIRGCFYALLKKQLLVLLKVLCTQASRKEERGEY